MGSRGSDVGYQLGLLSGIRPTTMLRLTKRLPTLSWRRAGRLAGITVGSLASSPLAAIETVLHRRQIRDHQIEQAPVFIIGHWRSGTTHLHNLLSQDDQFGCLDMFQALAPDYALSSRRWLKPFLERTVPSQRPMDNMEWPMDAPQEEEIPLAKMTPYSWYLQFLFPRNAVGTFEKTVLLNGAPAGVRDELKKKLLHLYAVASLQAGGRRLLLKNPVHTARIGLLLELFPDAKFVFIHRSPYEVFPSTVNLHRKILGLTSLQQFDEADIEANVLAIYPRLIDRYLAERELIPEGQLAEVAFADLDDDPVGVLESLYKTLDLGDFEPVRPGLHHYVDSLSGYRKNEFQPLSDALVEKVNRSWAIGFDEFGYRRKPIGSMSEATAQQVEGAVGR